MSWVTIWLHQLLLLWWWWWLSLQFFFHLWAKENQSHQLSRLTVFIAADIEWAGVSKTKKTKETSHSHSFVRENLFELHTLCNFKIRDDVICMSTSLSVCVCAREFSRLYAWAKRLCHYSSFFVHFLPRFDRPDVNVDTDPLFIPPIFYYALQWIAFSHHHHHHHHLVVFWLCSKGKFTRWSLYEKCQFFHKWERKPN